MCFGKHPFIELDEELRLFIPRPTKEEIAQLEANIVADGEIKEPVVVWGNILVDGYTRYDIARRLDMPFHLKRREFRDNDAAKAWMLRNQLGRRNLSPDQMSIIRGKLYNLTKEEREVGGKSYHQGEKTSEIIANQSGVTEKTVRNDAKFAEAVEKLEPEVREAVVNNEVKSSRKDVKELAEKPAAEQKKIVKKVKSGKAKSVKDALHPKELDESLPEHLRELAADKTLADYVKALTATVKEVKRIGNELGGRFLVTAEIVDHLNQARNLIANGIYHCVCPRCNGKKNGCHHCRKSGWLTKWALEEMESVA